MSKVPIGTRIAHIFQSEASANVPDDLSLWPRIHESGKARNTSSQDLSSSTVDAQRPRATVAPVVRRTASLPVAPPLRMSMAMALVVLSALVAIAVVFTTGNASPAASPQSAEEAFLPVGKVRHMIYTGTYTVDGVAQPSQNHREEFWLTQGKSHPLMRSMVTVPITAMTWLDDNAYYEYEPAKGNQVHKRPYDPEYLAAVVPDPEFITKTLQLPDARLVGGDTLEGRSVVVITVSRGATTTFTYWIDSETNQLLQIMIAPPASYTGPGGKTINKIVLNELIDRSELPADFFEFKLPSGATLVEEGFALPTPVP